jgi:hypothetical protein
LTIQDFIAKAQGYYCNYTPVQKEAVVSWLNGKSEKEIAYIYAEVLKLLSPTLRMPPCITELETAYKKIKVERWSEIYPKALPEYIPVSEKASPEAMAEIGKLLKKTADKKTWRGR